MLRDNNQIMRPANNNKKLGSHAIEKKQNKNKTNTYRERMYKVLKWRSRHDCTLTNVLKINDANR